MIHRHLLGRIGTTALKREMPLVTPTIFTADCADFTESFIGRFIHPVESNGFVTGCAVRSDGSVSRPCHYDRRL